MLMQSFKSADELNIPEPHREALMETLVLMETGKMKHVNPYEDVLPPKQKHKRFFNMAVWEDNFRKCGTICCIGGTAEAVGNVNFGSFDIPQELGELFNPPVDVDYENITVEQAATALRNYLTTGKHNWDEILKVESIII